MIINVMSERAAETASYELKDRTAIISVRNMDAEPVLFCEGPQLIGVKTLYFADTSEDTPDSFSKAQAEEIKDFLLQMLGKIDRLIVHCEFGVSRSAGIAAAVLDALTGDSSVIFNDSWYVPNMRCYRLVYNALYDEDGNSLIGTMECDFRDSRL